MYHDGTGVKKDLLAAYVWYVIATTNGATEGAERMTFIKKYLTQAQLAKAGELAQDKLKKNPYLIRK